MSNICLVVLLSSLLSFPAYAQAASDSSIKRNHVEDIFIWKMSDELKLSAKEEKAFTDINKNLNRRRAELNKKIQDLLVKLNESGDEASLRSYKDLLLEYNQLSVNEFDSIKKLLGNKRFVSYLKIKNDLNTKLKSMLAGEKPSEKKEARVKLPPPRVIIEKAE
jgi:Skp family chaperone for outer membrane proteins